MAKEILYNATIVIGGSDVSNNFKSATLDVNTDMKDVSCFGDLFKVNVLGLKDWSVELAYMDDFADNAFNEQLWGWWNGGVAVSFSIRPKAGAVSATNPYYTGQVILPSATLFAGQHGEVPAGTLSLKGTGSLARATS